MWNEAQFSEKWDKLYTFLRYASQGSKIVITTRDRKVAEIVGARELYDLQSLPSDDCWSLFARRAFSEGGPIESHALEAIGRKIVKKCAGVPLALRTLGGLMHSKKEEKEWLAIQNSAIWNMSGAENNNVMNVLKLSYDNLPSPVKRCFLYCCLFSKGVPLEKMELIQLWMAEGFLGSSRGNNKTMEDIGNEYVDNLCWNSFFQDLVKDRFGERMYFRIHDLVHDLGLSISGTDISIVETNENLQDPSKIRYMRYELDNEKGIPRAFIEATKLRTLSLWSSMKVQKEEFNNMFLNLKSLRVLDLSFTRIKELPSSICKLKHVRYIDISGTDIEELPKCITCLYNLQTLTLLGCHNLKRLPQEFGNLINLRHFLIDLSGKWSEMPREMRRLTCLQTLPVFKVGRRDDGCNINELKHLNLIRGPLNIYGLKDVRDAADAKKANLKGKMNISFLCLEWNRNESDDTANNVNISDDLVLEALEPPPNLKELRINRFGGIKFPRWIMSGSILGSLVQISFYGCNKCEDLPNLGQLPSLEFLSIEDMGNVKRLGGANWNERPLAGGINIKAVEEVRKTVTTTVAFPSLKSLFLIRMPNLEEWSEPMSTSFTSLEYLHIEDCPKLRMAPSSFPALTTLNFVRSSDTALELIPKNLSSLTSLFIEGFSDLKIISYELLHQNKFLRALYIKFCPQFEGFLSMKGAANNSSGSKRRSSNNNIIKEIMKDELTAPVMNIPIKSSFPQSAPNCTSASSTDIGAVIISSETESEDLLEDDHGRLTNLELLCIFDCPKLSMFPTNTFPSLKNLAVGHSNNTFVGWLTSKLTSLTSLWMENISDMSFLPTHLLQSNESLQELTIVNCPQLQDLLPNYDQLEAVGGQQYLLNLKAFVVQGCNSLTSIDLLQGLPSLRFLRIVDCRGFKCFPKAFPLLPHLESVGIGPLSKELDYLPFPEVTAQHQYFVSLQILGIFGAPEIKSLPHQLQHLKALKSLNLENFDFLIDLPEWLANIQSLEALYIFHCQNLMHLPSKEAMQSLALLKWFEIKDCPLLKERCNEEKGGEEWIKISHIPIVKIDEDFIQFRS